MDYKKEYGEYLSYFENSLSEFLKGLDGYPPILRESIEYAISGGGKRIRPVLCLSSAKILGLDFSKVKYFALAIEMIHSYSLVHDDLPAMDNDDMRRGKPSTHKKFGEAYGILCGDALLNLAYETLSESSDLTKENKEAVKLVSKYAGYTGMIKGQVLDMLGEKANSYDEKFLYDIYENKTAKLITLPLLVSSILAGGKYYDELKEFGYNLGVLFQITDDLLDAEGDLNTIGKTPRKDLEENKYTSIKVFGLDGAKERAKRHYESAIKVLDKIDGSSFLRELTETLYVRKS